MSESTTEQTQPAGGAPAQAPGAQTAPATPQAPAVDVQAAIDQALQKAQIEFQQQLKEATGHESFTALKEHRLKSEGKLQELAESRAQEAADYKSKFENTAISHALLTAAGDALDPELVISLLRGQAVVGTDGTVTVGGKPVKDAVTELLKAKPFLAKAQGGSGSGAATATGVETQNAKDAYEKAAQAKDVLAMLAHNKGGK